MTLQEIMSKLEKELTHAAKERDAAMRQQQDQSLPEGNKIALSAQVFAYEEIIRVLDGVILDLRHLPAPSEPSSLVGLLKPSRTTASENPLEMRLEKLTAVLERLIGQAAEEKS